MSDEAAQLRLQEANRLFQQRSFVECEATLRALPSKDAKVKNNIALAHFLGKGGDARETIRELSGAGGPTEVKLEYEGHEMAHYNRAVLLAFHGRCEEAAATLRELLRLHDRISTTVLGRSVCLFQVVTNETPVAVVGGTKQQQSTSGKKPSSTFTGRSKSDEELIEQILSLYLVEFKKDPQLARMLQMALAADGSAIHDLFRNGASPMERAVYFNDLGVMAMGEGKANVASLYFAKSYRLVSEGAGDTAIKHSVLFNAALCSIQRQDYAAALKALLVVQESMRSSPALWLRVAQSSLGVHMQAWATSDANDAYDAHQRALADEVLSKGSIAPGFAFLQIPDAATINSSDQRKVYLVVALRAAHNCIHLLGGQSLTEAAEVCFSESRTQDYRLLQYAYLYAAAAEMLTQNFSVAIKLVNDLLAVHKSRALHADVHACALLYASEALCRVNRPQQALKLLGAAGLGELLVSADRSDGLQRQRTEALFINLALVHICNGSWKQAQAIISTIVQRISANQNTITGRTATLLQLYLDLAQGNREKVLEQLSKSTIAIPAVV